MHSIVDFIDSLQEDTYPEPRTEGHDYITKQVIARLNKHLKPQSVILDVGCGRGPALEAFTALGHYPIGVTSNAEELKELDERFDVKNLDMHYMPFEQERFDCVYARHVLEHSPIPFYLLCEFFTITKPGGHLYLEVPAPDTACKHETNGNHYSVLGAEMWKQLIVRSGWTIEDAQELHIQTPAGPDVYFSFTASKQ